MEFALVGGVMLAIVLLYYMKMINTKASQRTKHNEIDGILVKVAVFESLAKDKEALRLLQKAIKHYPNNSKLMQREKLIITRLDDV